MKTIATDSGAISVAVRLLAEDQSADYAPWPGSSLVRGSGFTVWFGQAYYPELTVVRHVRLTPEGVEDGVRAARELIASRGRRHAIWSVGRSATPAGLADRLVELGMRPDSDPVVKAVVLQQGPAGAPSDVVVRRTTSLDDLRAFFRIQQSAFESDPELVRRGAHALEAAYEEERAAEHIATYLAFVEDEPVATACATFTDVGVVLNGGSTLHRARGRGAYRALVAARWDDAVVRGTPLLATLARPTSYPILKRMGFEDVSDVRMFIDEF